MEIEPIFTPNSEKKENIEEKEEKKKIEEICEQIRDDNLGLDVNVNNADEFIEVIENDSNYQEYLDQKVTMDTFREIDSKVKAEATKRDNDDLEYISDFLCEETKKIAKKTQEYYEIINSIENGSKIARFSGSEKFKKWTETKDKKRRLYHNSIVSQLGIFKRFLEEKLPQEFDINLDVDFFEEEELPPGLLENVSDYKKLSGEEKRSRQEIGEWAFTTGIGEKLHHYREMAQEIKKRSS